MALQGKKYCYFDSFLCMIFKLVRSDTAHQRFLMAVKNIVTPSTAGAWEPFSTLCGLASMPLCGRTSFRTSFWRLFLRATITRRLQNGVISTMEVCFSCISKHGNQPILININYFDSKSLDHWTFDSGFRPPFHCFLLLTGLMAYARRDSI